jgi:antitoxin component YwqK of YwqJK toxin-antitoxin module
MRKHKHCCMKTGSLFLLLVTGFNVYSGDTAFHFLDENLVITKDKEKAAFVAAVTKSADGWDTHIFYGDETLALSGTFKNKNLTVRHGWFRFYYAGTGRLMTEGRYEYDVTQGPWQSWYENGRKKDSGKRVYGKPAGYWKYWHDNGVLKQAGAYEENEEHKSLDLGALNREEKVAAVYFFLRAKPDIKTGLWQSWHNNWQPADSVWYDKGGKTGIYKSWYVSGQLEAAGVYAGDAMAGAWQWFYAGGQPATEEVYENGKVKSMKCYDSGGRYAGDYCSLYKPALFTGEPYSIEEYIKKQFIYPPEAKEKKIRGSMRITFTINAEGLPENIVFSESPSLYFTKEMNRILYQMPAWEPAISHNRKAAFEVSLYFQLIEYDAQTGRTVFIDDNGMN